MRQDAGPRPEEPVQMFVVTRLFLPPPSGRIISLSWHPSGALIAAGMMDMIRIFDANTGEARS